MKTAFSHAGSFVAVPALPHFIGFGRDLTFPVLLFAFGIGTGISKRRKPAWPLIVLAIAYLFGSVVNEALIDRLVAGGYGSDHPLPGGFLERLMSVATLTRLAHYADFLQPYLFFLAIALIADRLRRPIREWNPWWLMGGALALHGLGFYLSTLPYVGPGSMLWNGGYRSFQYAPLFAAGVLFGAHRSVWLHTTDRSKWAAFGLCVLKVAAAKALVESVILIRPMFGLHESLWKIGDISAICAGVLGGYLMLSAYGDLKIVLRNFVLGFFERIGRKTLIALSVQTVVLPLAGFWAIQYSNDFVRAAIGIGAFLLCVLIILKWDQVASWLARRTKHRSGATVTAEAPV